MAKFKTEKQATTATEEMLRRAADHVREFGLESLTLVITNPEGEEFLYRIDAKNGVYPIEALPAPVKRTQ